MDDITIARALHILAIVHWIGALALVTTVILPAARRAPDPARGIALFKMVEAHVAPQIRVSVIVAALSGVYMVQKLGAWERFLNPGYWWMHAMLLLWTLFAIVLFVAAPLRRRLDGEVTHNAAHALIFAQRAHWVLLIASTLTVAAAVLGAHGFIY